MGWRLLERMTIEEDRSHILMTLTTPHYGFNLLINTFTPLRTEHINNIMKAITKALPYRGAPLSTMQLLNDIRYSKLMTMHLNSYFINMMSETSEGKLEQFYKTSEDILILFDTMLLKAPMSSDQVFVVLTIMETAVKSIKKKGSLANSNELQTRIQEQIDTCNGLREERTARERSNPERTVDSSHEDTRPPPNNFREMSVIPTVEDVHATEKPFPRANKETGAYNDLNHYLDVQFRLLREDFIRPLRDGILLHKNQDTGDKKVRNTDIRVYESVQILYPQCTSTGVSYRIRFNVEKLRRVRWQATKRLIFGSLLCLSKDNFNNLIFATVSNRDPKMLAEGELDVHFEHDLEEMGTITPTDVFTMAETTSYFEAYRHVLGGLQNIDDDSLPFQQYLVHGHKSVEAPSYVMANREKIINFVSLCDEQESSDDEDGFQVQSPLERARRRRNRDKWQSVKLLESDTWPTKEELKLDDTQYDALQAALTKELAIIQGPPGTGKTYIGLKIVKILLKNRSLWTQRNERLRYRLAALDINLNDERNLESPILVVCYTNHALDQFLEGISEFCKTGIVRVGGRSKCEAMKKFSMRTLRQEMRSRSAVPEAVFRGRRDAQAKMRSLESEMDRVTSQLESCEKGILHEQVLQNFMLDRHYNDLASLYNMQGYQGYHQRQSLIIDWLGLGDLATEQDYANQNEALAEEEEEEIEVEEDAQIAEGQRVLDLDDEDPLRLRRMQYAENREVADRNLAFNFEDDNAEDSNEPQDPQQNDVWQIQKKAKKKRNRKIKRNLQDPTMMTPDEEAAVRNLWNLRFNDRWKLYRYWLLQYKTQIRRSIRNSEVEYQQTANRLREILNEEDKGIMKTAKVLGMTTTGAAKYRDILQEVQPKIIIVEEAAEVLEAHIVTTLSEGCKHLILIGDHKQLRPNPTVYELAEKYKLKVSLFERLLNNGMVCVTLGEQHRMRPEISTIMRHIYPNLRDHPSVTTYEDVMGVSKNVFFLDHRFHEDSDEDLKSKSNYHEAKFIAAFCNYLLLQGYQAEQITVLTAYTGQVMLLKKQMPRKRFEGIRITAIDNFQGEENDIILLSLVRSNKDNTVGFLKEDNRLCVALSRARQGLYVLGNFAVLEKSSRLWEKVVQTMKDDESLGRTLELYCQNHPDDARLKVQHSKDFENAPEGGCKKPCEYRLSCGHVCERMCHSYDKDHAKYKCNKICGKRLCNIQGHGCRRKCFEVCGDCKVPMEKVIPRCGHTEFVPCSIPPSRFRCTRQCGKKISCGHECRNYCGEDHECRDTCRAEVRKTLSCTHTVTVKCFQDPEKHPCPVKCRQLLDCEHPCPGSCSSCFRGRIHEPCRQNCGRTLVCGHPCGISCTRECPPCIRPCESKCVHSECRKSCGQPCVPCMEPCDWQCRHKTCSRMCSEPCDRDRCNAPCEKRLPCGHPCIGLCGELCPTQCRVCNEEEVKEIFFGDEDEDDARFVQLQDCGHIIEVNALDRWMGEKDTNDQGEIQIQMKKCPKCKTVIRKNRRYGTIINNILCDIENVKQLVLRESREEVETRKRKLHRENADLYDMDKKSFDIFEKRVYEDITYGELQCVGFGIQVVKNACEQRKRLKKKIDATLLKNPLVDMRRISSLARQILKELDALSTWATKVRIRFSNQEIEETKREMQRLCSFISLVLLSHGIVERKQKVPIDVIIKKDQQLELLKSGQVSSFNPHHKYTLIKH